MKTVIALFLFALGSAQAKLRADGRRAHRGLVVSDYRITCGECNASLATTTCTVYDYSSGAADPVETFDCDCPAECPADAADTFQCDVPSSLSSGVVGDGSFLISLDGGAAAQCRFESPPASTAECYVSYCPPPPERKLLCDPCDNNEVSCELFEDGTVVDTLACECPDGDCSTNFDCLAASAVAAGDIPFTVGVDDVEFSGMCKVDPTAAASTSVICQEECTTEEPTAKPSDAPSDAPSDEPSAVPSAAPSQSPTPCDETTPCGPFTYGSCCNPDKPVCTENTNNNRWSCKKA